MNLSKCGQRICNNKVFKTQIPCDKYSRLRYARMPALPSLTKVQTTMWCFMLQWTDSQTVMWEKRKKGNKFHLKQKWLIRPYWTSAL